jgi:hypothetical protein
MMAASALETLPTDKAKATDAKDNKIRKKVQAFLFINWLST